MDPIAVLNTALADRYEVAREIGSGGMATVYLARDVKHDRRVALKVLRPELGAVLGVDRFLAEIRVTANLQHPNLLPLFDSGEANGLLFYVMPFVEGETLRERLDREKQLPVGEAVRISVAIAGALEYAHQHGVIHRDLKPENILFQAGQPVLADFGIALAVSNAGGARVTQTGLTLGTPQYMSPEQAAGDRAIDARTDIYSLAAMTYEMLVGDPPHLGSTAQAIIAKVLAERPPSVLVARPMVGESVAYAVERGLEKLPADRWISPDEFSDALQGRLPTGAARTRTPDDNAGALRAASRRTRLLVAGSLLVGVAGLAAAGYVATRPALRPLASRFELGLPDSVTLPGEGTIALSRDGSKIVFVGSKNGKQALYMRRLDDSAAHVVRGTERALEIGNFAPTFSPDGASIAFRDADALKTISANGGTAQTLAGYRGQPNWGDGGTLALTRGGIWLGNPDGRALRLVGSPDSSRGVFVYLHPHVLPGGHYALVTLVRTRSGPVLDSARLGVVSLEDGTWKDLGLSGVNARYVATGHVVFGRDPGIVLAAPFSLRTRTVTGPATVLLENVSLAGGGTGFTASDNGTLAYYEGKQGVRRELVAVNRVGVARRIPGEALQFLSPRVSPDGRRIATTAGAGPASRAAYVALIDAATGAIERLTAADSGYNAEWMRDGARVLFSRQGPDGYQVVSRTWDRSGPDAVMIRGVSSRIHTISVGPRHGFAALQTGPEPSGHDILIAPMDSLGVTRPLLMGRSNDGSPAVSADGRLLAWVSDESGSDQVFVQSIPGQGPRVQVSVSGGGEPVWSRTGTTLFYRGPNRIMQAELGVSPLKVIRRDSLFADKYARSPGFRGASGYVGANWDVLPGGNEFLMIRQLPAANRVFVVLNWPQMKSLQQSAPPPDR